MTHFIPPAEEFGVYKEEARSAGEEDVLVVIKRAVDTIRAIDMLLSTHALAPADPQDVLEVMYVLGLGKMTRGEILKGGGYA